MDINVIFQDCYNCVETYNKERSGFSRTCVTFNVKIDAILHVESDIMATHYVANNIIDENGYYQKNLDEYRRTDGKFLSHYESKKIRSGCIKGDHRGQDTLTIPNLGWKFGTDYYYCIKCLPWIRYTNEWNQVQEYFECSCPKTI